MCRNSKYCPFEAKSRKVKRFLTKLRICSSILHVFFFILSQLWNQNSWGLKFPRKCVFFFSISNWLKMALNYIGSEINYVKYTHQRLKSTIFEKKILHFAGLFSRCLFWAAPFEKQKETTLILVFEANSITASQNCTFLQILTHSVSMYCQKGNQLDFAYIKKSECNHFDV